MNKTSALLRQKAVKKTWRILLNKIKVALKETERKNECSLSVEDI